MLRGRVLWAFRVFLQDRGLAPRCRVTHTDWDDQTELMAHTARRLDSFQSRLSPRAQAALIEAEVPEWIDAKLCAELVTAFGEIEGISGVRELGAFAADLLVDPASEPDPRRVLVRILDLIGELTHDYEVRFEPLRRVAGRLHLMASGLSQSEFCAEAWAAAVQAVLRRNCSHAWTLMEDVFVTREGSTTTILCQWTTANDGEARCA
ncbi:MAG: hypothetical protein R3B89_21610 [Polyangiaceae bacterium]